MSKRGVEWTIFKDKAVVSDKKYDGSGSNFTEPKLQGIFFGIAIHETSQIGL